MTTRKQFAVGQVVMRDLSPLGFDVVTIVALPAEDGERVTIRESNGSLATEPARYLFSLAPQFAGVIA